MRAEEGGDEAQEDGFVGKRAARGALFELLIDALDGVAAARALVMGVPQRPRGYLNTPVSGDSPTDLHPGRLI